MSGTFLLGDIPGQAVIVTDGHGNIGVVSGTPITIDLMQAVLAGLVTDSDEFYAPAALSIAFLAPALYDDADTTFHSALPSMLTAALISDSDIFHVPATGRGLLPDLVTDSDTILAPAATTPLIISPPLFVSDDALFAPTLVPGSKTLAPSRITDTDSFFFPWYVTLVGGTGGPLQKLRPPPKIQDIDTIYAARLSSTTGLVIDIDIIRTPVVTPSSSGVGAFVSDADTIFDASAAAIAFLLPAPLADEDAFYEPVLARVLKPELLASDDDIPAADVGWQVIAEFTADEDAIFSVDAYAFYPLYPEVWFDEEHIDTYPFFVQAVTGGIPEQPREGVLTGSIKRKPVLTGSIARRRLVA